MGGTVRSVLFRLFFYSNSKIVTQIGGKYHMSKKLLCPCCNWRLIDEGKYTISKAKVVGDGSEESADYYIKCEKCKNEIAIKKLN
jgi:hypothetical protein